MAEASQPAGIVGAIVGSIIALLVPAESVPAAETHVTAMSSKPDLPPAPDGLGKCWPCSAG